MVRGMSGYKPGYSEDHSPYWQNGVIDGMLDAQIVTQCPPGEPIGPDDERSWSLMYMLGYASEWDTATPHICTPHCRSREAK